MNEYYIKSRSVFHTTKGGRSLDVNEPGYIMVCGIGWFAIAYSSELTSRFGRGKVKCDAYMCKWIEYYMQENNIKQINNDLLYFIIECWISMLPTQRMKLLSRKLNKIPLTVHYDVYCDSLS